MGLISGLIVAAVIIGAGVYAASAKKSAAKKAAKARDRALDRVKASEPTDLQSKARQTDEERFAGQLDLQKRLDPNAAAARETGLAELAGSVRTEQDTKAAGAADQAYAELAQEDPNTAALRTKLLTDARAELEAGAELPPEFQAEITRAGLEQSSRSGVGVSRMGAAGQTQRKLLGAAGMDLKARRAAAATAAVGAEAQFTSARQQVLSNLSSQLMQIGNNRQQRAANAVAVGNASMPEWGLSGREFANAEVRKQDTKNQVELGKGEVQAGQALAQGAYAAEIAGSVASGVTAGVGAYGAYGGGAAGAAKTAAPIAAQQAPVTQTPAFYGSGVSYNNPPPRSASTVGLSYGNP